MVNYMQLKKVIEILHDKFGDHYSVFGSHENRRDNDGNVCQF